MKVNTSTIQVRLVSVEGLERLGLVDLLANLAGQALLDNQAYKEKEDNLEKQDNVVNKEREAVLEGLDHLVQG